MSLIQHVLFVHKITGVKYTPEQLVDNQCGLQFICASLCNYGKTFDDSDESWNADFNDFYNDGLGDGSDVAYITKAMEAYKLLKSTYTYELYSPKCLTIQIAVPVDEKEFDEYVSYVRRQVFSGVELGSNGQIVRDEHDDYEQANHAYKLDK